MEPSGSYDPTLQMFVQEPREPDLSHLRFLRWLGERGYLEHDVAGPPRGAYADARLEPSDGRWPRAA